MKRLLQTNHRPIVWIGIYFTAGIIGGSVWNVFPHTTFLFFCMLSFLPLGILSLCTRRRAWLWIGLSFIIGFASYYYHPVEREKQYLNDVSWIIGTVVEQREAAFGTNMTLDNIKILKKDKVKRLQSKVKLLTSSKETYAIGSILKVNGSFIDSMPPMNPSDMNYPLYLKGEGIVAEMKGKQIEIIDQSIKWIPRVKSILQNQIDKVFQGGDQGIMACLLLGEEMFLDEEVSEVYYTLGIGHVLAISGLHIGILFSGCWQLLSKLKITYHKKIMGCLLFIWFYAVLVGLNVSAIRACLILTIMYIGRMLWEEEDQLISLALAGLILLGSNPYQLFQVGFQLSFAAYGAIILVGKCIEYWKIHFHLSVRRHKFRIAFISNVILSIIIAPILAWHFFEIPFLGTLLNLMIVPLFSILLPVSILLVSISFVVLRVAQVGGKLINLVLMGIEVLGDIVLRIPYATVVVGRPSIMAISLFYMGIAIGIAYLLGWKYRKYMTYSFLVIGVSVIYLNIRKPQVLEVMHLYVGQGDSTVIITPNKQVIVIDGGSIGKEKVVERYIKYRGYTSVDYAIVSHGHEDHIGGVLGLLESRTLVKNVMMPEMAKGDQWEERLKEICRVEKIPYYTLKGNELLQLGSVTIEFMDLVDRWTGRDTNDLSAVCLLRYGGYTELFTGDISGDMEKALVQELEPITVLKVAHHGSKTSTSKKFLEQTKPKYGIISCGINNRYTHPHLVVTKRLEEMAVEQLRTDRRGAIKLITDGKSLSITSQIQEDKK